jgi:hypothetical protein
MDLVMPYKYVQQHRRAILVLLRHSNLSQIIYISHNHPYPATGVDQGCDDGGHPKLSGVAEEKRLFT